MGSKSKSSTSTSAADNSANAGTNSTAKSVAASGSKSTVNLDESIKLEDDSINQGEGGFAVKGSTGSGTTVAGDQTNTKKTNTVTASEGSNVTIQDGSEAAIALANSAVEHLKTANLETINSTRSVIDRVTTSAEGQSRMAIENLTDNKADPLASKNIKSLLIAGIVGLVAVTALVSWFSSRRSSK